MLKRVLVKGTTGAGKSTLARELAQILGVPFVELDALHHGPNWTPASPAEMQARTLAALGAHGWVVDGNYDSKIGTLVIDRAELIVWLDLPLRTKLVRVARRTLRRSLQQEVLWNGNRENWVDIFWGGDALLPWMLRAHFRHRRVWPQSLAGRVVVRLRTRLEVSRWLAEVDVTEPRAHVRSERRSCSCR